MSVPTVASLCSTLGHHLTPVAGQSAPSTPVTAVHISELVDPTAYLSGGELLLTTGLTLPPTASGCRDYVGRLVQANVSALALGLGPHFSRAPARLIRASSSAGLPLLIVPAPTPFLKISRAYWTAFSRSTEKQLSDAAAAHGALVSAAVAPDPAHSILRRLARLVDGWAALLDTAGELEAVFPHAVIQRVQDLRAEAARLSGAGVHSSASFKIEDDFVVLFPLAVDNLAVGYIAVGSPRQLEPVQRRVVLTAAALLSLDAVRGQRTESASEEAQRCVAILVDQSMPDAARRLATQTGCPAPSERLRIVAMRGRNSEDLLRSVRRWCQTTLPVTVDRGSAWVLVPDDHPELDNLIRQLRSKDSSVSVVVSDLIGLSQVSATRARALQTLTAMPPGNVRLPQVLDGSAVTRAIAQLSATEAPEIRAAVVAYLRHQGRWEPAAKELNLHRNTLRYRIGRARQLLALDFDDPDIAAQAWLALRAQGVA